MKQSMKRTRFLSLRIFGLVAAIAMSSVCLANEPAAAYPSKPVKVLVGFPPGQGSDAIARTVASRLQAQLGQTFFVENKTGASGGIAQQAAAAAAPDGYTLLREAWN